MLASATFCTFTDILQRNVYERPPLLSICLTAASLCHPLAWKKNGPGFDFSTQTMLKEANCFQDESGETQINKAVRVGTLRLA